MSEPEYPTSKDEISPEEQVNVEVVKIVYRSLAHLINNELGVVVPTLGLLGESPSLSQEEQEDLADSLARIEKSTNIINQLNRVKRIRTKDTPFGPMLDLEASIAEEPPQESKP